MGMAESMLDVQVFFTPEEMGNSTLPNTRVVVLDVLRATSAICAGLHAGIACFRPVLTTDESLALAKHGFIPAAERGGLLAPGFEVGNSPLVFRESRFCGAKVALTTTNGTRALWAAKKAGASEILVGSFLGLDALIHELLRRPLPTILLCSGWQGKFSWEDTLLAGALAEALCVQGNFDSQATGLSQPLAYRAEDDRVQAARSLWLQHRHDLPSAMRLSSHYQRLASQGLEEDIAFCAELNVCPVFGRLAGEDLVLGN